LGGGSKISVGVGTGGMFRTGGDEDGESLAEGLALIGGAVESGVVAGDAGLPGLGGWDA